MSDVETGCDRLGTPPAVSERLLSVDALRGFDMFWIIGADATVAALAQMNENPITVFLTTQLTHVEWVGFHFYDLIFPLFLFIVGISTVFSLDKAFETGGRATVLRRVARRGLLLYALGVFYYGGISQSWADIAWTGVIQRIAVCYVFGALIYTFVRSTRGIVVVSSALLIGYWALLTFVPIPDLPLEKATVEAAAASINSDSPFDIADATKGRVRGLYEEGHNLTNFVDFLFLRGRKSQIYYINEGLLSTLPAIALPLFGILAGCLLKNRKMSPHRKIRWLLVAGAAGVALGLLWSLQFPVIKRIWSSSFILVSGGLSAWMLALFFYIIDVRHWRRWSEPLLWIGSNALVLYIAAEIVPFQKIAAHFVGGDVAVFFDHWGAEGLGTVVITAVSLLLVVMLSRFLYRRRIFVRV